ncbi:hypothetical protein M885DRAFT_529943 [Pelagophyceae sp. CCMP2097]|nr:hypothetical protein M885DRAFT_529943 [Pelagophyceae sp. CCMP2097]
MRKDALMRRTAAHASTAYARRGGHVLQPLRGRGALKLRAGSEDETPAPGTLARRVRARPWGPRPCAEPQLAECKTDAGPSRRRLMPSHPRAPPRGGCGRLPPTGRGVLSGGSAPPV